MSLGDEKIKKHSFLMGEIIETQVCQQDSIRQFEKSFMMFLFEITHIQFCL